MCDPLGACETTVWLILGGVPCVSLCFDWGALVWHGAGVDGVVWRGVVACVGCAVLEYYMV